MRKDKYITRTIVTTDCSVIGIKLDSETVERRHIVLNDKHENNDRTFELCKRANKDANFIPSKIAYIDYDEAIYGCTVEEFLAIAKIMPDRWKAAE